MRRIAGNLLIGLGVALMAMAVLWVIGEITGLPDNPNEDQRGAALAGLLFAAVLVILGVVLGLTGLYVRQSSAAGAAGRPKPPGRRLRPLPLTLYLGGSIAIALFAAFIPKMSESVRPLWLLVGQPFIFAQVLLSGIFGIRFESDVVRQGVVTAVSLLYYLVLFCPVYRIVTMDRASEPAACRRMRTFLILFISVHVLIGLAISILAKA